MAQRRAARQWRTWQTPVWLALILLVLVVVSGTGSSAFEARVTTQMVLLIVVVGIYSFIGTSGVVSFGHISFMAIGAYTGALLTVPHTMKRLFLPDLPDFMQTVELAPPLATLVGGGAAALFAAIVGFPLMRLSGLAAAIAMFAMLLVVNTVIGETESVTRGYKSLSGIPFFVTPYGALAWAVGFISVVFWFHNTRYCLRLRASREDEFGARAVGVSIAVHRYLALILSAFIVGVGGALYGGVLGSISPKTFFIEITFTTIVMLVVGGMHSLSGAVIGAIVISAFSEGLRIVERGADIGFLAFEAIPGLQLLGASALGLLIVLFRPRGLTLGREIAMSRWIR